MGNRPHDTINQGLPVCLAARLVIYGLGKGGGRNGQSTGVMVISSICGEGRPKMQLAPPWMTTPVQVPLPARPKIHVPPERH
mmetsp:Transcript_40372/g.101021  ORF Transcript_40372/g.101021 Transcript_40372/m.101021 type:complete len:82 (+) Transcript_40372:530-775(+)